MGRLSARGNYKIEQASVTTEITLIREVTSHKGGAGMEEVGCKKACRGSRECRQAEAA